MHIVSNCCTRCDNAPKPSLDIGIIPGDNGGIGVFSITTHDAGEIFMFVPYQDTVGHFYESLESKFILTQAGSMLH